MAPYRLPESVRVLIVDDDEDDFVLARAMLDEISTTRCEIDWARDAASGRKALGENEHDVCLLDYRLDAADGLELLRENKALGFAGPIIMLTGQGDAEIDILASRLGAADFLIKGEFDGPTLERTLRYALAQKSIELERVQNVRDQQARIEAESANRAKDEFLAMVAHELRSPLQSISLWTSTLQEDGLDAELVRRGANRIAAGVGRLAFLVDDLMDASRMVTGQLELQREMIAPDRLVAELVESLRPRAQEAGLSLEVIASERVRRVFADGRRFQQIVDNLVTNAIKFTPPGGKVLVELRDGDRDLTLRVRDTGAGIRAEALGQIFARYQRCESSGDDGRAEKGGLGLGLSIVEHLVRSHGGTVHAQSDGLGRGSTFTVVLPRLDPGES